MMMRSENDTEMGPVRDLGFDEPAPTPLPEAPPEREARARRRIPWITLVIATIAVVAIASAAVLAVSRSNLSRNLTETRVELDATDRRLADAQTQAEGSRQQVESIQSQLEDANAATRDARTSLSACQDLFRLGAAFSSGRRPSPSDQSRAAAALTSCFEGKFPPSLFP